MLGPAVVLLWSIPFLHTNEQTHSLNTQNRTQYSCFQFRFIRSLRFCSCFSQRPCFWLRIDTGLNRLCLSVRRRLCCSISLQRIKTFAYSFEVGVLVEVVAKLPNSFPSNKSRLLIKISRYIPQLLQRHPHRVLRMNLPLDATRKLCKVLWGGSKESCTRNRSFSLS